MKSIYVIIDASSYINLSALEYRFGTLLTVFDKEVTLRYSSTVNQEIARHWNNKMPGDLKRSAQIYSLEKYTHEEYEQKLFDKILKTSKDKGEKDNFAVALDLFFMKKKSDLVFLYDDDKALEGFLNEVKYAFPIIRTWNSFDVVLFLYFLNKKVFPLEVAERALHELHKQMIPKDDPNMDKEKMEAKLKKRSKYLKYLERIKKLH